MNCTSPVTKWKLFKREKAKPHIQLSFETTDGLIVKNLCLKHPNRPKTIQFLKSINGQGSFRAPDDLESIITMANFRPVSAEWRYSNIGDRVLVRVDQKRFG